MPNPKTPIASPAPHPIRATYRLQFHAKFTFDDGGRLAGYLRDLGISHVYSSPILTARSGSMHGYDVVAYDSINPALGGENSFREMARCFRQHDIGIILDIVPNHVAVGGDDNLMWLDLLRHGPESRYAKWFDIDFDDPDPELNGKVLAPFLSQPRPQAIRNGAVFLEKTGLIGGYAVKAGEHIFPIRVEDEAEIAEIGLEAFRKPDRLSELLARQNFVLDAWWNAGDRINWRRFFDITQLAAIRMDNPEAYSAKHDLIFQLYRDGIIDGLRIDHVDGLADPAEYCQTLRRDLFALQSDRPATASNNAAWLVLLSVSNPSLQTSHIIVFINLSTTFPVD